MEKWQLKVFWWSEEQGRASFSSLHFVPVVLTVMAAMVGNSVVAMVGGSTHMQRALVRPVGYSDSRSSDY